jgi:glycosyltransferase involved in cell wall biosynthesis
MGAFFSNGVFWQLLKGRVSLLRNVCYFANRPLSPDYESGQLPFAWEPFYVKEFSGNWLKKKPPLARGGVPIGTEGSLYFAKQLSFSTFKQSYVTIMTNSENIRLLIVTDTCWPSIGGIENAIVTLVAHLPKHIHCSIITHRFSANATTLFANYRSTTQQTAHDPSGHPITTLKVSLLQQLILLPLLLWNLPGLKRIIPASRLYDILYFFYKAAFYTNVKRSLRTADIIHSFSTGWLSRLVSEICKATSIPIVHSPAIHFGRWGDSPAQLKAYTSGNATICFTETMRNKLISKVDSTRHDRFFTIPPVIPANSTTTLSRLLEGPYILFIGRREAHKGLTLLVEAFKKINLPMKLVIAGPGEKIIDTDSSVIDLGPVSENDKVSLLSHCELLAVPTTDESFGIVFTEAMSYGKPAVAVDIAPVNEIVRNGITGILVPQDDADSLAQALTTLLTDDALRHSMGARANDLFNSFYAPSAVVPKIVAVYEKCITKRTHF